MSDRDPDRDSPFPERDEAKQADDVSDGEPVEASDGELPVDGVSEEELSDEELSDEELSDEELFDALDDPGAADPFTEMDQDTEAVGDDVFEMVADDETAPTELNIEPDPEVEEVTDGVVVPKRSYCERCRHFSEPPVVGCTNPGTTIHELVDVTHFRVSNCPVVGEQRDDRASGE